ncbi:MAG: T9SS type A sorting domain-containing protein [Bacteroidales bacterium]|nr:T9SS type A sorting domain-containing protein [Bacteroidales bacterium]
MKKIKLFIILFFVYSGLYAQDYQISFSGTGASSTVESVEVENLTQGTSLTINGDDILHLVGAVGINNLDIENNNALQIYPNPTKDICNIKFDLLNSGYVSVELFEITGKKIFFENKQLKAGIQYFSIRGLNNGIYFINIKTTGNILSGTIISNTSLLDHPQIYFKETNEIETENKSLKNTKETVQMQYNEGDLLFFRLISGNYSTISTLIPSESTTVTVEFVEATDGDSYHYSTVKIGTQTWMGENLRATHYNDGTLLPNVTNGSTWINLTTPAYCWFDNNYEEYGTIYGALYNWFVVTESKNICPVGWHIPSDQEWATLMDYLGGETVAGGKLKQTGTEYWNSPNTGANNESGFTGLPGDLRFTDGNFTFVGVNGYFWTSTETNGTDAWYYVLNTNQSGLFYYDRDKIRGHSIRCILD